MATKTLRQSALDFLARREHSRFELSKKLTSREFPADDITFLLDKLEQENLLSDERFTEAYVNWRSRRGYGPERIKRELLERGVASQLINQYIALLSDQWLELAAEVRNKKFGIELPRDFSTKAKQMSFLQYRGFTLDQINAVIP